MKNYPLIALLFVLLLYIPAMLVGQATAPTGGGIFVFPSGIPITIVNLTQASDTLFASATHNASVTTADFTNLSGRGCQVIEDTTTVTGSGIFTVAIDGKDTVSGKYYNLITSANISTVSTNVYRVYPGLTASANLTVSDLLPKTYRCRLTLISGTSQVNSVGINYLP